MRKIRKNLVSIILNSTIQKTNFSKIIFGETIDFFAKIAYNNSARRGRFGAIFVIAKPMTSNVRLGEC